MRLVNEGIDAIESLSIACKTSFTATAFRYVERTRDPVAVVLCTQNGTVLYSAMSKSFRDYPGAWMPSHGTKIQSENTCGFIRSKDNVVKGRRASNQVSYSEWFGSTMEGELIEDVIGLGSWGKCLIILTPHSIPSPEELLENQLHI